MPSSYIRVILHTTFSTKYRRPYILPEYEEGLYQFISRRFREHNCNVIAVGGTLDHLHILHGLPRDISIADVMGKVKSLSSKWMKKQGCLKFRWQIGYACHSVDYRRQAPIERYVRNQKVHHYGNQENYLEAVQQVTFEEEFKRILDSFDMPYDPAHLFETSAA